MTIGQKKTFINQTGCGLVNLYPDFQFILQKRPVNMRQSGTSDLNLIHFHRNKSDIFAGRKDGK